MRREIGGERRIRTLEGLLTLTPLAGVRLRPLGHLSVSECRRRRFAAQSYWSGAARARSGCPPGTTLAALRGFFGLWSFRGLVLDAVKDLLALYRDRLGCIHAQTD